MTLYKKPESLTTCAWYTVSLGHFTARNLASNRASDAKDKDEATVLFDLTFRV